MAQNSLPDSQGFESQIRDMMLNGSTVDVGGRDGQPVVRLPPDLSGASQVQPQHSLQTPRRLDDFRSQAPPGQQFSRTAEHHPPQPSVNQHGRLDEHHYRPSAMSNGPGRSPAFPAHNNSPQRGPGSWRRQQYQQIQLDPNAYQRGVQTRHGHGSPGFNRQGLFNPNSAHHQQPQISLNELHEKKAQYLELIARSEIPNVEMTEAERSEKYAFCEKLAKICDDVCALDPQRLPQVSLEPFGSFRSGFANAGSDMDLVIVVKDGSTTTTSFSLLAEDLPRALEKKLLQTGYGARLLSRTRVPIIKICEKPSTSLLDKLREERYRWDFLPNEKKYPHLFPEGDEEEEGEDDGERDPAPVTAGGDQAEAAADTPMPLVADPSDATKTDDPPVEASIDGGVFADPPSIAGTAEKPTTPQKTSTKERQKPWTRERKAGPLDFPKTGVGIQCDINFFNPLGIHNTQLLRCYSLCDPRVRPMILFIKSWAKQRKINSSYSGTLSSYGYVLMVLHYLVNIAQPPVLPNLQSPWRPNPNSTPLGANRATVDGWMVDFWRNEDEIQAAVRNGEMSSNRESLGSLIAGFFQYYSSLPPSNGRQFHWMREVLALRIVGGGLLTKEDKGWVKAKMEEGEGKKVQHRYLFCIEDPFELSHNVARTVTHNGIVAIRDEFRRAHRILMAVGYSRPSPDGELFDPIPEEDELAQDMAFLRLEAAGAQDSPAAGQESLEQRPLGRLQSTPKQRSAGPPGSSPQHFRRANNTSKADRPAPGSPSQGTRGATAKRQAARLLDMDDKDAFPALGSPKAAAPTQMGSISGARAKAHLDEFRKNKKKANNAAE